MNERTMYFCSYCGMEFYNKKACLVHEEKHIEYNEQCSNETLSNELRNLANRACDYRVHGKVVGIPLYLFQDIMNEAAKRIADKEDNHE